MKTILVFLFVFVGKMTNVFGYYMHKMSTTGRLLSSARKTELLYGMQFDDLKPMGERDVAMKNFQQQLLQLAAVTAFIVPTSTTWASDLKSTDYAAVKREIINLIKSDADLNKGPTLVRLSWHSSGTYSRITKTGGSGKGTIRFQEELAHGANAGLQQAVDWLEPIYSKYQGLGQDLSHADLYTLAGVVAIETLKGPKIPWRAGRFDTLDPSDVTPDGRLPSANKGTPEKTAEGLREVFGRMGFNDQEIVALSGAHALGRCHSANSGFEGPWTYTPNVFNNLYYVLLKTVNWVADDRVKQLQYTNKPDGVIMMLPSDLLLRDDPGFKEYVDLYAASNDKFFSDFTKAFQKLQELGTSNLRTVSI